MAVRIMEFEWWKYTFAWQKTNTLSAKQQHMSGFVWHKYTNKYIICVCVRVVKYVYWDCIWNDVQLYIQLHRFQAIGRRVNRVYIYMCLYILDSPNQTHILVRKNMYTYFNLNGAVKTCTALRQNAVKYIEIFWRRLKKCLIFQLLVWLVWSIFHRTIF